MSLNNLRLNKDKTELLCLYSKHRSITSLPPLRFGKDTIHPSYSARTIGVIFLSFSMLPYVNSVSILQAWLLQFSQLYNVPKYVLKSPRALAVTAPDLWNRLPDNIRSCDNLTYLFRKAYYCWYGHFYRNFNSITVWFVWNVKFYLIIDYLIIYLIVWKVNFYLTVWNVV